MFITINQVEIDPTTHASSVFPIRTVLNGITRVGEVAALDEAVKRGNELLKKFEAANK